MKRAPQTLSYLPNIILKSNSTFCIFITSRSFHPTYLRGAGACFRDLLCMNTFLLLYCVIFLYHIRADKPRAHAASRIWSLPCTLAHFLAWGWASFRVFRRFDRLFSVACGYYVKQETCARKKESRCCGTFNFTRPAPASTWAATDPATCPAAAWFGYSFFLDFYVLPLCYVTYFLYF